MANLNDKLISYGNLAEFHNNLLNDSSVSNKATWSSQKISAMIADAGFAVEIVAELPATGDPHTIYFILKQDSSTGDVYDEWMYIDGNWEMVGNTQIDLSDYAKISDVDASLALKADKTYVDASLATKQGVLTAGQNISIDASNNISAEGYVFDSSNYSFATKYRDDEDPTIIGTNIATGNESHAEGWYTQATGDYGSHSEGSETQANGAASHAEGNKAVASGTAAHAEGNKAVASGNAAHAEGNALKNQNPTTAAGAAAHAEGASTLASGNRSHTEGELTEAKNPVEHAQGNCNLSHKNSDTYGDSGNTIDSIGIGYTLDYVPQRKNATEVMQNGDMYVFGVGGYQGIDTKVQNASIMTVQEVINSKADAYEVATLADILALFAEPVPPTQPNDEIWYTTNNNQAITIDPESAGGYFDKPMLSNTYSDGKGIIKFDGDLTLVRSAFQNITEDYENITSVQLPESVTELAYGTFEYCSNLVSVKLPTNYTGVIPEQAFNECSSLESIEIPEGTTLIGDTAFSGCSSLTTATIPLNVEYVGYSAFNGCSSLELIICEPTTPPSPGYAFEDTNDCPIYVPAESVNAYKTAEGWTDYASRIYAIQ